MLKKRWLLVLFLAFLGVMPPSAAGSGYPRAGGAEEWDAADLLRYLGSRPRGMLLLAFCAEWCGPCQRQHGVLDRLSARHLKGLTIATIDTDRNRDLAGSFRVQGLPTLVLFVGDRIVGVRTGYHNDEQLSRFLRSAAPGMPR